MVPVKIFYGPIHFFLLENSVDKTFFPVVQHSFLCLIEPLVQFVGLKFLQELSKAQVPHEMVRMFRMIIQIPVETYHHFIRVSYNSELETVIPNLF